MKVLITGGQGQLGRALQKVFASSGLSVWAPDIAELDITGTISNIKYQILNFKFQDASLLINCAAYTNVDKAEAEPELALRVNAQAAETLAQVAKDLGMIFVHISTDYVFSGRVCEPYTEASIPDPLSVYGRSKAEGERLVAAVGASYYIVRSAGLYGHGGAAGKGGHTMLDFVIHQAKAGKPLKLVTDQCSSPTFVEHLAEGILNLVQNKVPYGLYHMVNQGGCTWFEFGQEVLRQAGIVYEIQEAKSNDFMHRPAARPAYSILANTKLSALGLTMPTWQQGIRDYLDIKS